VAFESPEVASGESAGFERDPIEKPGFPVGESAGFAAPNEKPGFATGESPDVDGESEKPGFEGEKPAFASLESSGFESPDWARPTSEKPRFNSVGVADDPTDKARFGSWPSSDPAPGLRMGSFDSGTFAFSFSSGRIRGDFGLESELNRNLCFRSPEGGSLVLGVCSGFALSGPVSAETMGKGGL
jgi:hypothetical protein